MKHIEPATLPQVLPPDAEPWRKLLWDAADYMEKHGWCSGVDVGADAGSRRVCTVNAVISASRLGSYECHWNDPLLELAAMLNINNVPRWSDSSDQHTVVTTMRRCALEG